jgi:hypothetical protein
LPQARSVGVPSSFDFVSSSVVPDAGSDEVIDERS